MFSESQKYIGPFPVIMERKTPFPLHVRVFVSLLIEQASNVTAVFLTRDDDVEFTKVWAEEHLGKHKFSTGGYQSPIKYYKAVKSKSWTSDHARQMGFTEDNKMSLFEIASGLDIVGLDDQVENHEIEHFLAPKRDFVFSKRATIYLQAERRGNNSEAYYIPVRLNGETTLRRKLEEALQKIVSYTCPRITLRDIDRVFPSNIYSLNRVSGKGKIDEMAKEKGVEATHSFGFEMSVQVDLKPRRKNPKPKLTKTKVDYENTHLVLGF